MQIERLFGIMYRLMNQGSETASELAAHFEVSVRTIYRDIDALSKAGIPVYANKGRGGGISITDGYILNKSLFTEREQREILYALKSMNSVSFSRGEGLLSKLSSLFKSGAAEDWVEIDFSGWSRRQGEDFNILKAAILEKRVVAFSYYSTYGEVTEREVEPQRLWFKHRAWYLKGFCRLRGDMRLFKISRMRELRITEAFFTGEMPEIQPVRELEESKQKQMVSFKLRIDGSQAYRVYDEFEDGMFTKEEDGSFTVSLCFPEDEWVYGFILGFGTYAQVLEPERLRRIISGKIEMMRDIYAARPLTVFAAKRRLLP